jgi:membrane protease YdiL (CAAX protease family)
VVSNQARFVIKRIHVRHAATHVEEDHAFRFRGEMRRLRSERVFGRVRRFMELFGATGRYLPAAAVVGILLTWHIARSDPWRFRGSTMALMGIESALLAFPVITLGGIINYYVPLYAGPHGWQSGVVLSLGAGIYEELVFRLICFTILNILLVDVLRCGKNPAHLTIVIGSALLFALYHYWSPQSAPFRVSDFAFRTLAGVYFGLLFVTRGFGITAGAHASYDIFYFLLRA